MTLSPGVRFDPTITLGSLLTGLAMLAALFGAYASITSEQRSQAADDAGRVGRRSRGRCRDHARGRVMTAINRRAGRR